MSRSTLPRILFASLVCLIGLAGIGVPAASAAVQDRIVTGVSNASRVTIPNSVHPKAALAADLGPAPTDTKLGMSIRFNMSAAQEAGLDQLLTDQQNPASPQYHQWLTPAQYAAQFGLSSGDIGKVTAWLASQGFSVTGVANGGTFVTFDGTIGQAQTAFATSIHNLSYKGETHFANVTDVQVPAAFGGVVMAVTGLHNFRLQPRLHTSIVTPEFTSSQSGNHFIAPGDLYTIYNSSPLLNAGTNGAGETIAVTGQVDIYPADVMAFRSAAGLSTTNLPTTVHAAGVDPGPPLCTSCTYEANQSDLAESSIDVEWSGAMAPAANIVFVNAVNALPGGTGTDAMTWIVDNNLAPIVTTSYGACEAGWGSTDLNLTNALFKQANAQGQTILAAAGDAGATDCDTGPTAQEGLAVDFPGSSPYVTSMGGTQFNGDAEATGSGTTWAATQYWAGTSGSDVLSSALSYIPEQPWNNSIYGFASAGSDFGGGGGGASAFFTKPTWQVGTGVPADGSRDVPDLALNASDAHDAFLFCVNVALDDSCTSGFRLANGDLNTAGGTSFDSQIFSGMLALIEQKLGTKLGNANPIVYALANNSTYYTPGAVSTPSNGLVFNDVTSGNNAMICVAGTTNCANGGTTGFSAGTGYDLASGWGSVNVSNLANGWAWGAAHPLGVGSLGVNTSATSLSTSTASTTQGGPVTLTATVTSGTTTFTTTPTGTVQFLANNVALGAPVSVTPGAAGTATASYSWVTSCTNFGQNVMSASYSGDSNYQGSKGPALTTSGSSTTANGSFTTSPVQVQITGSTCPDFSVSTPATVTVAAGGTIPPATITVTPVNGFVGTVTFSVVTTSTTEYSPTFVFSPASVTITATTTNATTSLALSGITASLHRPDAPGKVEPGTMFARQTPTPAPHASRTWYAAGSGVTIASLLLWTLPRKRRLGGLLLVALAIALIGGASGCGSSQAGPPSTGSTTTTSSSYAGSYFMTIVGTYTNSATGQVDVHDTAVTYVIN